MSIMYLLYKVLYVYVFNMNNKYIFFITVSGTRSNIPSTVAS